jgi:hypothetical protein
MYEKWRLAPCILGDGILQYGAQYKEYNTFLKSKNLSNNNKTSGKRLNDE